MNLFDYTLAGLTQLLQPAGFSAYHAGQIWDYLYRQRVRSLAEVTSLAEMTDLRPDLQDWLAGNAQLDWPETAVSLTSSDNFTQKYLLRLADGQTIETVLMQFEGREGDSRATACVSTQVGCAMGCVFCATGQMGFTRHLSPGEIVAQALYVDDVLQTQGQRLRNIVLMGMGEPLHNYDNVMTAVTILTDHKGLSLAPKHITLSTVGVVPGIRRLADEAIPIRLAVSLHGATDAERQALVPPARRWPLAELMDACRTYIAKRQRRIFFEWTLIDGENDTPEQAHALGQLLHGMTAHVNLIPLNPTTGYDGQPTRTAAAKRFQAILADYGLPSTIRQRRGIDIAAGCGQLRAANYGA
jgi:23S rRNA (adenine2503-C2)-methyltransferase